MRSLWEKIQEIERNLKKNGRGTDPWMVSMRMYFSLRQVEADMLETCPWITWGEIIMGHEILRMGWAPFQNVVYVPFEPTKPASWDF